MCLPDALLKSNGDRDHGASADIVTSNKPAASSSSIDVFQTLLGGTFCVNFVNNQASNQVEEKNRTFMDSCGPPDEQNYKDNTCTVKPFSAGPKP